MRALLVVALGLSTSMVHADQRLTGSDVKSFVDAQVHQVLRDGDTRVVAGRSRQGWWLFVDRIERGRPAWQYWITEATWGHSTISVASDLHTLQITGFNRQVLSFTGHYQGRDWLRCSLDTRARTWRTSCEGTNTGTTPTPPPPPQTNWAGNPGVIKACGDVFDGQANESACLDTARAYRYDPTTTIAACDRAMDGDENELRCVRWGSSTPFDQSASLMSCDNAMDGDENELKCFGAVINARYVMTAAIEACDRAMDGDENEMRCIVVAVSAARDPSETIAACDKAMDGDESELACIKRGIPTGG